MDSYVHEQYVIVKFTTLTLGNFSQTFALVRFKEGFAVKAYFWRHKILSKPIILAVEYAWFPVIFTWVNFYSNNITYKMGEIKFNPQPSILYNVVEIG